MNFFGHSRVITAHFVYITRLTTMHHQRRATIGLRHLVHAVLARQRLDRSGQFAHGETLKFHLTARVVDVDPD